MNSETINEKSNIPTSFKVLDILYLALMILPILVTLVLKILFNPVS